MKKGWATSRYSTCIYKSLSLISLHWATWFFYIAQCPHVSIADSSSLESSSLSAVLQPRLSCQKWKCLHSASLKIPLWSATFVGRHSPLYVPVHIQTRYTNSWCPALSIHNSAPYPWTPQEHHTKISPYVQYVLLICRLIPLKRLTINSTNSNAYIIIMQ